MNSVRARARTIADQLIDAIVSGKYPPGSRLPTELELPFDPGGLAARVGQATADGGIPSAVQLAEARRVVEAEVAGLAAVRRTAQDLTALGNALDAMRAASRARDVDAFATADLAFHQAVMDAAA